ncbi:MAG: hypothetical protein HDKAJFGB_00654 [Anaerolineae bacterium]|nr:hypothetical protein [Anaerolineae bacterium]
MRPVRERFLRIVGRNIFADHYARRQLSALENASYALWPETFLLTIMRVGNCQR